MRQERQEQSVSVKTRAGRGSSVEVKVRLGASVSEVMWAACFVAEGMSHSSLTNLVDHLLGPNVGTCALAHSPVRARVDGNEIGDVITSTRTVHGGEEIVFHL